MRQQTPRVHQLRSRFRAERYNTRPRWLVPAVSVGFLALLTLWVVTSPASHSASSRSSGSHNTTRHPSPATHGAVGGPTSPLTTQAGGGSDSSAGLNQAIPDSPPTGITWQTAYTLSLPVSATAGPTSETNGVPSGFALSPTGALLAAVQISFRLAVEPNFIAVLQADVANTPGKTQFPVLVAGATNPANPAPGTYLQLAGFQFISYTPSTAVIQLLASRSDGTYQVSTLTVSWDGADWQLVLQPTGAMTPNQQVVSTPVGFVTWSGS